MATENYLLSVQGVVGTSYNECVLCFQSAGVSPTDTLDAGADLITAFRNHAETEWLATQSIAYQLLQYSALRAFPKPSGTAYFQLEPGTAFGQQGADSAALNVCPAVHLIPPMGTKTGGRVFLPTAPADAVVDNSYDGAYVVAVSAFFDKLLAGLAGSGTSWKLAIFSRKNVSASLALAYNLSPRVGFQGRRRKPTGAV